MASLWQIGQTQLHQKEPAREITDIACDIAPASASSQEAQIIDTTQDFALVDLQTDTLLIKSVTTGGAPTRPLRTDSPPTNDLNSHMPGGSARASI